MPTVFIELCAGSAAVTRKLLDLPPILGFMGNKDRFAQEIIDTLKIGIPDTVILNDIGFWGCIWGRMVNKSSRRNMAALIKQWSSEEARPLWERLKFGLNEIKDPDEGAAARLCLLSGTYGGGEIGGFKGKHKLRPKVDGFIPSRLSLVSRLEDQRWERLSRVRVTSVPASNIIPDKEHCVYIDPPYSGLTGYINNFSRDEVVDTARKWAILKNTVGVSEAEPVGQLSEQGWTTMMLSSKGGQIRKNTKCKEYLTFFAGRSCG